MILDTVERARGRWREILPRFGVETRFLQNRHGPCRFAVGETASVSMIATAAVAIIAISAAPVADYC
jgi:hypothetical protein